MLTRAEMNTHMAKTSTDHDDDDLRSFGWFYGATVYTVLVTPLALATLLALALTDTWSPFVSTHPEGFTGMPSWDMMMDDLISNRWRIARIGALWATGLMVASVMGAIWGRMSLRRRIAERRTNPAIRGELLRERMLHQLDVIGRAFTIRSGLEDTVRSVKRADPVLLADMEPCLSDLTLLHATYLKSYDLARLNAEKDAIGRQVLADTVLATSSALAASETMDHGDTAVVRRYMDAKYRGDLALGHH